MRKKLIIAVIVIACLVVAAVTALMTFIKEKTQVTYTIAGSEQSIEIEPGEFPYGDYKLTVTHDSGAKEEVVLTEDMILEDEKIKLYRLGEQKITVTYKGASCEISVNVKYKSLDHITLSDKTVTYTGEPIVMSVEGNLPADVTVRYPYGNVFTNAGEYDVTAIVYGNYYKSVTLTARLTILKADYDVSGITIPDGKYVYDGTEKSISVTGTLPAGLTVSYSIGSKTGNSAIDVGEYQVTAKFSSNDPNYNPLKDMSAKLTVEKATPDMKGVSFPDVSVVYDKQSHGVELVGQLPEGVAVDYYTTKKKETDETKEEEESRGNGAINVGAYVVTVRFTVADLKNYCAVEPMTANLIIKCAEYHLDGIYLNSDTVVYSGRYHTIALEGKESGAQVVLPEEVSLRYTTKKIYNIDGSAVESEETEGNGAIDAGIYRVTAHFELKYNKSNYLPIPSLSATLIINQASVYISNVTFTDGQYAYDGNEHSIRLSGEIPQGISVLYTIQKIKNADGSACEGEVRQGNGAVEAGTYKVIAALTQVNDNYDFDSETFTAYLVISGGEEQ